MTTAQRFPTATVAALNAAFQQQVEFALHPRRMQEHLSAIYAPQAVCHILDAKYEADAHCSVLYQLGERLVIGEVHREAATLGTSATDPLRLPAIQTYPYEDDPALPGLTTALDGQKMAATLNAILPECVAGEARVLRCGVTPLRYRLGKRCTLRFDLRLRDNATGAIRRRTLYGKLYHTIRKAQAVYAEMGALAHASALQAAKVEVAHAVAFAPSLPMVFQSPVQGAPLDLLLHQPKRRDHIAHPHAVGAIRSAAAALAALHQVAISTDRERPVAEELLRFQQRTARVSAVNPTMGAAFQALAAALPVWLDQLPVWGTEESLVHGDCKPSQFLVNGEPQKGATFQIALLDFDHCGIADPAADVGNFLATLRQEGAKQALRQRNAAAVARYQQWLAMLEEQFLKAYLAARPCHPAFRQRALWYQAVALLRKALRSFSRSSHSPLPGLLVREAWECLGMLAV